MTYELPTPDINSIYRQTLSASYAPTFSVSTIDTDASLNIKWRSNTFRLYGGDLIIFEFPKYW